MCQTENVRANCSARWALAVSQSYRAMCYPVGSSNLLFSPNPTQELHCWHRLWWKGVWRRCLPRQCLGEDARAIQVLPGGNVFKPWQQYVCNEINGLLGYKTWGAPTRGVCSGRRLRRAEILCSHNPKLQVMCTFPFVLLTTAATVAGMLHCWGVHHADVSIGHQPPKDVCLPKFLTFSSFFFLLHSWGNESVISEKIWPRFIVLFPQCLISKEHRFILKQSASHSLAIIHAAFSYQDTGSPRSGQRWVFWR